jgi:hypothetical protein
VRYWRNILTTIRFQPRSLSEIETILSPQARKQFMSIHLVKHVFSTPLQGAKVGYQSPRVNNHLNFNTHLPRTRFCSSRKKCWRIVNVNIIWANMLMNVSRVIFGRLVTQGFLAGLIIESKEPLSFTIKEPEISDFHNM